MLCLVNKGRRVCGFPSISSATNLAKGLDRNNGCCSVAGAELDLTTELTPI